jgi:hypothetical protein
VRTPYYGNSQINQSFGVGSTIQTYDPNSWGLRKEELPITTMFNPVEEDYTPWQLDRFADAFLWEQIDQGNRNYEDPCILMYEHLHARRKKEIYVASGTPDQTFALHHSPDGQMLYWRTHPQGRAVNSEEQRKSNAAGFYR